MGSRESGGSKVFRRVEVKSRKKQSTPESFFFNFKIIKNQVGGSAINSNVVLLVVTFLFTTFVYEDA